MDGSVSHVQQTPRRVSAAAEIVGNWTTRRRRLNDPGRDCRRQNLSATRRPQSAPHQWLLATSHQYATCLLSSYQHDSWSLVAESSPRQNGRTFLSVLFNSNSKTAVRLTPTFLRCKVTVLHTSDSQLTHVITSAGQVFRQFRQTLGMQT